MNIEYIYTYISKEKSQGLPHNFFSILTNKKKKQCVKETNTSHCIINNKYASTLVYFLFEVVARRDWYQKL